LATIHYHNQSKSILVGIAVAVYVALVGVDVVVGVAFVGVAAIVVLVDDANTNS